MAARTIDGEDPPKAGRRAPAANSPRWCWRSTDLFESEEEAWILVSRWRAQSRPEDLDSLADGHERRGRRAQDRR
jgi:hypothetical protein